MKLRFVVPTVVVVVGVLAASQAGVAQSAASNKAFFTGRTSASNLYLAPVTQSGSSPELTLYDIPQAIKTSSTGGVSAILSMECALWTYNITTDLVGGGKSSSSSRAALKAWVEIDGQQMEPGQVTYCDRLQATELEVDLGCSLTGCQVTGQIALGLFQRTKNANSSPTSRAVCRPSSIPSRSRRRVSSSAGTTEPRLRVQQASSMAMPMAVRK